MRLAIFVDQIFWRDGSTISTDESYALFPASFADYVEKLVFIGRGAPEDDKKSAPYVFKQSGNISLLALPSYPNLYQLWRANPLIYPQIRSLIEQRAKDWDVLLISGPHPIGQMIARQCAALGVVIVPMVRQNLVAQMQAHENPALRTVASLAAQVLEWDFKRLSRGRTVLTVGAEMMREYEKFSDHVCNHFPCLIDDKHYELFAAMTVSSDPSNLICVSRLAPEKGHRFLFDALKKLQGEGLTCRVAIAGGGALEDELKSYVSALGLDSQVVFHGYVPYGPPLFELYRQAGAMVLPSLTEGFPQVINESLSIGLPTICSAVGGIPSFVTNNETGLLLKPKDVPGLADAIRRVVTDRDLRESLRVKGRALMKDNTLEANRTRVLQAITDELARTKSYAKRA